MTRPGTTLCCDHIHEALLRGDSAIGGVSKSVHVLRHGERHRVESFGHPFPIVVGVTRHQLQRAGNEHLCSE
jgi:hypothetical protein